MRTILTSARIAVVSLLLLATGLLAPLSATRAASSNSIARDPSIIGTVVATPQHVLPATMFIQVGSQTIPVTITNATELSRRFGGASRLSEFTDGDTVEVIGSPNESGGITAHHIVNQSVQEGFTELHGTVASINPPGVVPTTIVLTDLTAAGGVNAPYPNPLPAQMSLPVSAATMITIGGVTAPASIAISKVAVGNHVSAVGVYDRFTNSFDSIETIVVATPPPPVTMEVKGTLAAAPGQLTAPVTLCLKDAGVTSVLRPNALGVVSPCPIAQLAVYVTSTTRFIRLLDESSSLIELSAGDTLSVVGTFVNEQFLAGKVQDRSIHLPSVAGPVQSIMTNGNVTNVVITVAKYQGAAPVIPIGSQVALPLTNNTSPNCVTPSAVQFPCTSVTTGSGTTNGYTPGELALGQTITATGVYNTQLLRFIDITKVVAATPPPPPSLTIKGILAATPSQSSPPATLCLRNAVVTASAVKPFVGVSPCPTGQMPVAVTAATKITRGDQVITDLRLLQGGDNGDTLLVTGSFINTVFTAAVIRDTPNHPAFTTIVGVVGYVSPFTHPSYFTMRQRSGGDDSSRLRGPVIVVYVGAATKIYNSTMTFSSITAINPGQTVTVVGVYNRKYHAFTFTDHVLIH